MNTIKNFSWEQKKHLGSIIVRLNTKLFALVQQIADALHPVSQVAFEPSRHIFFDKEALKSIMISPSLSVLCLEKRPRVFNAFDGGRFRRVGLDQHAHVPNHLNIHHVISAQCRTRTTTIYIQNKIQIPDRTIILGL